VGRSRGFTLAEAMISMLVISALGLGIAKYMKKSNSTLRSSDMTEELRSVSEQVQSLIATDLSQVAFVNPLCVGNSPTGVTPTINCSSVKIRGGITILPGTDKTDVHAMTSFGLPANYTSSAASLTKSTDSFRLVVYDQIDNFSCRLGTADPSLVAEQFSVDSACTPNLAVGKLYVVVQSFGTAGTVAYANLVQVTAINTGTHLISISTGSSNRYNQTGGIGISGFTQRAMIFPVKMVEWSIASDGVYRREISPSSSDLVGLGTWRQISPRVESMQAKPVTITSTVATEHNRTLSGLDAADENMDGIEDLRGLQVDLILKSARVDTSGKTYTNSHNSSATADTYPRQQTKFFTAMKNFLQY